MNTVPLSCSSTLCGLDKSSSFRKTAAAAAVAAALAAGGVPVGRADDDCEPAVSLDCLLLLNMLTPILLPPRAVRLRSAARLLVIAALDGTIILPAAAAAHDSKTAAAGFKAAANCSVAGNQHKHPLHKPDILRGLGSSKWAQSLQLHSLGHQHAHAYPGTPVDQLLEALPCHCQTSLC